MSEDEELEGAQYDATREKTNIEKAMWNEPVTKEFFICLFFSFSSRLVCFCPFV